MQHSQVLGLLCIFLSSSLAYGPHGVPAWQQWIPGSGYGEEFFVATNATNDASCAVEFFTNVTVYMGDPNCNSTVYDNVDAGSVFSVCSRSRHWTFWSGEVLTAWSFVNGTIGKIWRGQHEGMEFLGPMVHA
eukprot:GFUD01074710.1.p1 GENE.GFUD01074710.1~~GFUD01074710.1.p1  ORF type:complete len:145 (-),score=31.91 GFUD01074710.1:60-455(-)